MNELHQKLAVLSSSLNTGSPQIVTGQEGMLVEQQQQQHSANVMGSPALTSLNQQQQQMEVIPQQMTVDGGVFVQQQQQHPMQTVVVNSMYPAAGLASSGVSPVVLNVPVAYNNNNPNINNNITSSSVGASGSPAATGLFSVQQPNFHQQPATGDLIVNYVQQQHTPINVVQDLQSHPTLLITATRSPITGLTTHHPHHPQHHHPINDLAANSLNCATPTTTTPSTTTTIVTTNKLIEAVTSQGGGPGGINASVSIYLLRGVSVLGSFTGSLSGIYFRASCRAAFDWVSIVLHFL